MRSGTAVAKALSFIVAVYIVGVLVWAWAIQFRAELDEPLLVLYLSLFTAAFVVFGAFFLRWAWRRPEARDGE